MFDYRNLPTCDYPVPVKGTPSGEGPCSDPAVAFGWWYEEGVKNGWYLCQEHLDFILEKEKAIEP